MMWLQWEDRGWSDYLFWQNGDEQTLLRINTLIQAIMKNPYEGIGKPEPLGGTRSGLWARRIDDSNRLIYGVQEEVLRLVSCRGTL